MKKTEMIWKNLLTSVALTMIICLTGCQNTPDAQIVIGADSEKMINILEQQDNLRHPFVEIDTPDHVKTQTKRFGKMHLLFDANVIVPPATAYPITEVKKRTFTDEDFLFFIETTSDSDAELYSKWDLSKQEWLERQIEYKAKDPDEKLAQDYLRYLQEMYDNADSEVSNPLFDVSTLTNGLSSQVFAKRSDGTVAYYHLSKDRNNITFFRDIGLVQYPDSITKDIYFDETFETAEQFSWRQSKKPEISKEEAYVIAFRYINDLGIDLKRYSAETCTFLKNIVNKSVGWSFTFTRVISNAQTRYDLSGFGIDENAMPSYGAPWDVEECTIGIDKDGLCFLEYKGASTISREIQNSVELEKFDVIVERIANQLSYIYGTVTRGNGIGVDIVISEIELGVGLISVKNETDIGIYIPTWYVDYYIKWSDQEDIEKNWELNTIIFNAIDGSYIEPRVTNEKLMSMLNGG